LIFVEDLFGKFTEKQYCN